MERLPEHVPLKAAWRRSEEGKVEDVSEDWTRRWDEAIRTPGGSRNETLSRRPPRIHTRKTFQTWLSSRILSAGQRRSALRWYLYWLPRRRDVTRRQAEVLNMLRKAEQGEEEIRLLKDVIKEMKGGVADRTTQGRSNNSQMRISG